MDVSSREEFFCPPATNLAAWHQLPTHFQPHLPHHRHPLLSLHHLVVPSAILIFDIWLNESWIWWKWIGSTKWGFTASSNSQWETFIASFCSDLFLRKMGWYRALLWNSNGLFWNWDKWSKSKLGNCGDSLYYIPNTKMKLAELWLRGWSRGNCAWQDGPRGWGKNLHNGQQTGIREGVMAWLRCQ